LIKRDSIRQIGVFTSGGDSPGMNAAIYGIAKASQSNQIRLVGIQKGFEGMIAGNFVELDINQLQKDVHRGGTILKTARSERFRTEEGRKTAKKMLEENNIDALIAIGGDGTFKGLLEFSKKIEIPLIGIPGTIDNDLAGTDYTLGFDTAVNTAIQNIDKIRDTAESHNRVFIVEVMGRDSGYIAINSGLGTGADAILIPEKKDDINLLLEKISNYKSDDAFIIIISEGDEVGIDITVAKIKKVNPDVDIRITKLGHIQRGGNPSGFDRMLGIRLGVSSIESLQNKLTNVMVGLQNNKIVNTPFKQVVKQHTVDIELQKLLNLFGNSI
jgi:6-phosphofructokinase 1